MTTIAVAYTSKGRFPKIVSTGNSGNFDSISCIKPLEKEKPKEKTEKPKKVYAGNLPVLKPKAYFAMPDGIKTSKREKMLKKFRTFELGNRDIGLTVDGKYGTKTETAVAVFQELYVESKQMANWKHHIIKAKIFKNKENSSAFFWYREFFIPFYNKRAKK